MPQIPIRGSDLMGKLSQAATLKSSMDRSRLEQAEREEQGKIRQLSGDVYKDPARMGELASLDVGAAQAVEQLLASGDKRVIEQGLRISSTLGSIAASSNNPEEWARNIDYAMMTGQLDPKVGAQMRNSFHRKNEVLAGAEDFKTKAERAYKDMQSMDKYNQERRRKEEQYAHNAWRDEHKEELRRGRTVYPNADDINFAGNILESYFPDIEHTEEAKHAFAFDFMNNISSMGRDKAMKVALENISKNVVDEPKDKPGLGTGDYARQYKPKHITERVIGDNKPISYKGSNITILNEDPERGVQVQDENGRTGWIKTSLEQLYRNLK